MKESRPLGWLGGLFVVAALALGACADDPDDAQQAVEQPAQQAAVVTVVQQVQTQPQAAAEQPAEESEQQPAAQTDAEQAEAAAQAEGQQEDETGADSASGSAQAEGDASGADPELLAQLAKITALNTAWSEQITSLELHSVVTLESDLLSFEQTIKLWMQLEPLRMYMETELPNFFAEMAADFADEGGEQEDAELDAGDDTPPPPFVMKILINEDGVFMEPPESEGWVRVPDEGFDISQVMALGGGLGDEISDAISAEAPLLCAELSNGTVTEEELDGRPVWLVTCDVELDAVDEVIAALSASGAGAAGLGMPLAGEGAPEIQAMTFMVWIDRETGAVPAFNSVMSVSDGMTQDDGEQGVVSISTVATLIAWNSPIEFPLPEPLIEEEGYFE